MNVWLSSGSDHLWNIGQPHPATSWEAEIDQLMEKQLSTVKPEVRKLLYNRVQEIFAENVPLICLVSPNILVGAKNQVANFEACDSRSSYPLECSRAVPAWKRIKPKNHEHSAGKG